ncbi:MAG: hypothetical protein FWB94_05355 [Chitinispirillia bacterium]|nr:hypothetical protein [Chitinispirillia bacterium]
MNVNPDKKPSTSRIIDIFGSRRVFMFYLFCLIVTVGTMVASIVTSFIPPINQVEKMLDHVSLCVGALLLLCIPIVMHRKYDFRIPWLINITIAFMILAHFVLGEIYRFYDHVFLFDKLLHLTGGLVIAACGFSIVYGFSRGEEGYMKLSPFFAGLFSFCFALALLVLWEVFEYYVDTLGGYNMQRWRNGLQELEVDGVTYLITSVKQGHGLVDTMNDLIIGIVGAAVVSVIGGLWFKKKPDNTKYLIVRKKLWKR